MRVKEGFVAKKLGDQNVVLALGKASETFHGMIRLNESGRFLWDRLAREQTKEELTQALQEEYGISQERAQMGVEAFLAPLLKAGILDE